MARTNYSYEKRQKELARQKKQEEKRLRKLEKRTGGGDASGIEAVDAESIEVSADGEGGDAAGTAD